MTIEIVTIACLADNFAYLVRGPGGGGAILIDAPEAAPVVAALGARGWELDAILITHHHHDHVGAVAELRARTGARVVGPAAEADRLPPLDLAVRGGDAAGAGDLHGVTIAVPGHTLGHVAYHFPAAQAVFTADSLMACGCGRVFEGRPAQMWDSLSRLAALPPGTQVYSGHDYLDGNIRFALTLEPENPDLLRRRDRVAELRRAGRLPMPWTLAEERATNPFLRAGLPAMKARMDLPDASDAEVFAAIRAAKDGF